MMYYEAHIMFAAALKKLGGKVTLTPRELEEARQLGHLFHYEQNLFDGSITIMIEGQQEQHQVVGQEQIEIDASPVRAAKPHSTVEG